MEAVIQKFRSAISGFNRRDVLQYIEQTAAAHRRETAELEERLARSEEELSGLRESMAGLQDEKGTISAEEARVRASLEESTRTLTKLRGEMTQTESMLKVARAELKRLQDKVGELTPMAQRYEELKDRVATVELDAHRKAQATVEEAERQAQTVREETRQWLSQTMEQYDAMRQALGGLFESTRAVADIEAQLARSDEQAAALREKAGADA